MDYYRTIYSIFIEDNNNNVWKLSAIPPSISRKKRQLRFNPRWGPNHRTDDGTQRIILLEIPFTCKMAAVVCSWHAPPPTLSPPFPSFPLPPFLLSPKRPCPFQDENGDAARSVATPVLSVPTVYHHHTPITPGRAFRDETGRRGRPWNEGWREMEHPSSH